MLHILFYDCIVHLGQNQRLWRGPRCVIRSKQNCWFSASRVPLPHPHPAGVCGLWRVGKKPHMPEHHPIHVVR